MVCFSWSRGMIRIILLLLLPILKMRSPEWNGNRDGFISGYISQSTSLDPEENACLLGYHMAASKAARKQKVPQSGPRAFLLEKVRAPGWRRYGLDCSHTSWEEKSCWKKQFFYITALFLWTSAHIWSTYTTKVSSPSLLAGTTNSNLLNQWR